MLACVLITDLKRVDFSILLRYSDLLSFPIQMIDLDRIFGRSRGGKIVPVLGFEPIFGRGKEFNDFCWGRDSVV